MSIPPRPAPRHVPTLTEVIEVQPEDIQPLVTTPPVDTSGPLMSQPAPVEAELPEASAPAAAAPLAVAPPPASTASSPFDLGDAPIPRSLLVESLQAQRPAPTAPLAASVPAMAPPVAAPAAMTPAVPVSAVTPLDEAQIAQRVLADLQRQIDGMLEYRLREALAPILARTSEALVRELRQELSKTMKDVVARSVAQEVARQRSRG